MPAAKTIMEWIWERTCRAARTFQASWHQGGDRRPPASAMKLGQQRPALARTGRRTPRFRR